MIHHMVSLVYIDRSQRIKVNGVFEGFSISQWTLVKLRGKVNNCSLTEAQGTQGRDVLNLY